jgi:hypothetical protein
MCGHALNKGLHYILKTPSTNYSKPYISLEINPFTSLSNKSKFYIIMTIEIKDEKLAFPQINDDEMISQ